MNESDNSHYIKIQDVKIMYLVNVCIKCLPDDKGFGHAVKYHTHLKYLKDPHW